MNRGIMVMIVGALMYIGVNKEVWGVYHLFRAFQSFLP